MDKHTIGCGVWSGHHCTCFAEQAMSISKDKKFDYCPCGGPRNKLGVCAVCGRKKDE